MPSTYVPRESRRAALSRRAFDEGRALALPAGVTVRKPGEPIPAANRPRNALERAAMCDSRDEAVEIISRALGLLPSDLPAANLSDPWRWSRIAAFSRLNEIAGWLRAECFECMDFVESAPISTIGD